eukprot:gene20281-20860_t
MPVAFNDILIFDSDLPTATSLDSSANRVLLTNDAKSPNVEYSIAHQRLCDHKADLHLHPRKRNVVGRRPETSVLSNMQPQEMDLRTRAPETCEYLLDHLCDEEVSLKEHHLAIQNGLTSKTQPNVTERIEKTDFSQLPAKNTRNGHRKPNISHFSDPGREQFFSVFPSNELLDVQLQNLDLDTYFTESYDRIVLEGIMIQTRSLLRKGGNLSSIARRSLSSEAEIEVDLGNVFTTHNFDVPETKIKTTKSELMRFLREMTTMRRMEITNDTEGSTVEMVFAELFGFSQGT